MASNIVQPGDVKRIRMKITVVIAAYNEAENIGVLTARLASTLDAMDGFRWELVYVIEGTDKTREVAQAFADQRPKIRILYNREPSGLGNAFRRGFDAVSPDTDVIVTMDADLNHQPEEMPRLVRALMAGNADIVVGSRKVTGSIVEGGPIWKRAVSDVVNRALRHLMGMPVADMTSGYRAYRYDAFRRISFDSTGFAFLPEILMRGHALGLRVVEEPIQFVVRVAGESKMGLLPTARSYIALFIGILSKKLAYRPSLKR
jgi:dolichol-phosphate mannosyltransferase